MHIRTNESLARHTTLHVGGCAAFFVEVATQEELREALVYAATQNIPWKIIGGGSNTLVSDAGFDGLVIKMSLKGIEVLGESATQCDVRIAAGEVWDDVVAWAVECGYWGIENLSAIPGTAGATPIQNVGAYGVEIADVLVCVETIDTTTMECTTLQRDACHFAYRDSVFKRAHGAHHVVTHIVLRLQKNGTPRIEYKDLAEYFNSTDASHISLSDVRTAVISIRSHKFPNWLEVGTAGSFFKNPIVFQPDAERLRAMFPELPLHAMSEGEEKHLVYKASAAWLLDRACNLKGHHVGNVALFERQPLVLVAYAGATAHEIDTFASEIEKKVFDVTGIHIEREVRSM